jgi:hypothetical protein
MSMSRGHSGGMKPKVLLSQMHLSATQLREDSVWKVRSRVQEGVVAHRLCATEGHIERSAGARGYHRVGKVGLKRIPATTSSFRCAPSNAGAISGSKPHRSQRLASLPTLACRVR